MLGGEAKTGFIWQLALWVLATLLHLLNGLGLLAGKPHGAFACSASGNTETGDKVRSNGWTMRGSTTQAAKSST